MVVPADLRVVQRKNHESLRMPERGTAPMRDEMASAGCQTCLASTKQCKVMNFLLPIYQGQLCLEECDIIQLLGN